MTTLRRIISFSTGKKWLWKEIKEAAGNIYTKNIAMKPWQNFLIPDTPDGVN